MAKVIEAPESKRKGNGLVQPVPISSTFRFSKLARPVLFNVTYQTTVWGFGSSITTLLVRGPPSRVYCLTQLILAGTTVAMAWADAVVDCPSAALCPAANTVLVTK